MLASIPAIKAVNLLQIAPFLAAHSVSSIEFFERLGVSPNIFQNVDAWLPRAACFDAANQAVDLSGDPFAGATIGHATPLEQLGKWGGSVLAASDVANACLRAAGGAHLVHNGSAVQFLVEQRKAQIIFSFQGHLEFDPQQFILGTMAVLRKVALLAGQPDAVSVHLTMPSARDTSALEASLGSRLELGRAYDMVEIDRELLDLPVVRSENAKRHLIEVETAIRAAVMVYKSLPHGPTSIETIAWRLGLSGRTLQRRLKYCGIEFRDLLDETRRSEALRLLMEGDQRIIDIAYGLGYSDPSHFTRAFKRWKGLSPLQYARALRAEDDR